MSTTALAKKLFAIQPLFLQILRTTVLDLHLDIPLAQLKYLKSLQQQPVTINASAACLHVRAPTISAMVEALQRKGLVKRVRGKPDRRIVEVRLTSKGQALLKKTMDHVIKTVAKQLNQLSGSEIKTVSQAMSILERTFINAL